MSPGPALFMRGLAVGFSIAAPVGPIGLLCIRRTLAESRLAGLATAHLNLLRGQVEVVEALTEVNGHLAIGPTKTGARRAVSLPRFLVEILAAHLERFGAPLYRRKGSGGESARSRCGFQD